MGTGNAIRAGRAFVELLADDSQLQKGLAQAQRRIQQFASGAQRVGRTFTALGGVITAPLIAASVQAARVGDDLSKMSDRTGVSVEALSELEFAANQSGTGIDQVGNALFRMQRRVANASTGTGPAVRALKELGFAAGDLTKLSPEDQFLRLADAISKVPNQARAAQLAFEVFGDSAKELMPLIRLGADGIEDLQSEAQRLGITITRDMADAAVDFTDDLDALRSVLRTVTMSVGQALIPVLSDAARWVTENAATAREWIQQNQQLIATVFKVAAGMTAAGVALVALGTVAGGAAQLLMVARTSVHALHLALTLLAAHPIVLGVLAVGAAVAVLAYELNRATREARSLVAATDSMRDANQRARAEDQARAARLETLAEKQNLSNAETAEAKRLIDELGDKYGELGFELDATARTLTKVGDGMERVLEIQNRWLANEINRQIEERRALLAELEGDLSAHGGTLTVGSMLQFGGAMLGVLPSSSMMAPAEAARAAADEIARVEEEITNFEQQLRAIRSGDTSLVEADLPGLRGGLGGGFDRDGAMVDRALRQRREAELALIDDVHEQQLERMFDRQQRELDEAMGNEEALHALREAHALELEALLRKQDEDHRRRQERIQDANESRAELIEELQIRADSSLTDDQRRRRLLDLERQSAIEAARAAGERVDLVEREFDLRREILESEIAGAGARRAIESLSAFAGSGALQQQLGVGVAGRRGGAPEDRTARATERTAAGVEDVNRELTRQTSILSQSLAFA